MDRKVEYNSSKLVKRLISLSPDCAASKVDAGIFRFQTSGKGHDFAELYARLESLPTSMEPALQPGEPHTRLTYNRAAVDMFDKAMMDAIYTLWLERPDKSKDECEMSYISIYGKICGRDMICVSEIMKNRLKESLRKLQHIEATLVIANDNPRVLEYFAKNTLAKEYTLKSTLIKCEEYSTLLPNKERIYGINLLKCPILYRYAEAQRQLRGIEFDWLNIGGNMSLKKLGVRDMLIGYITGLSRKNKNDDFSYVIKYSTIMQGAGFKWPEDRKLQYKDRKLIDSILDIYKERGKITGYEVLPDKSGVGITL